MKVLEADNQSERMTDYTIEFDKLINPTKLYLDYIGGGMSDFYRYNFLDDNAAVKAAKALDLTEYDREKIYGILYEANRNLDVSNVTLSNIELLKRPETICIFSGQQTAFCANPMYVIYKALTTVKLAKRYSKLLDRPVVPCFWMATDDHDFEEVRSANFLLRSGDTKTITYNPVQDPSGFPVSAITLDQGVNEFCDSVNDALIDTEFKKAMLAKFHDYYSVGNKLSNAFARVFNHFLGDWGIILVDPNFPGVKDLYKSIFAKEISGYAKTFELYENRSENLKEKGYHAQVHKCGSYLNMFYHKPERVNLVIEDGKFKVDGTTTVFSPDELIEQAKNNPDKFSTNVLLRPIAQCRAFPTLAHVVGPSELAYFAQIEPLFSYFEVPFPIAYPRAGMTIIEPHIKKILSKYELDLSDLKNNLEPTIGKVVERLFPSEAANNIISISDCMKKDLDSLAAQLKDSDPEGQRNVLNFKKHIDFEVKQLRKKLNASNKKRHEELTSQIRRASAFLFPGGGLQERVISPLYYANKFGLDIFKTIYDALEVDKPVHTILEL